MSDSTALARTLAAIRRSTGLTREEFGIALDPREPYSERAVKRWETQERDVTLKVLLWAVDIVNHIQMAANVIYHDFPPLDPEAEQHEYLFDLPGPRPKDLQLATITDPMYRAAAGLAAARRLDEGDLVTVKD